MNRYLIIVLSVTICSCGLSLAKTTGQEIDFEKKSLYFILNNIDSLPVYNTKFLRKNNAKVYYRYWLDISPGLLKDKMDDYTLTKDSVFNDSIDIVKRKNLKKYNVYLESNISSFKIYEFSEAEKVPIAYGDLFIIICKKWQFNDHFYVKVILTSEGAITESSVLIKFDLKGRVVRVLTNQGET